jgi:hypothetical protein
MSGRFGDVSFDLTNFVLEQARKQKTVSRRFVPEGSSERKGLYFSSPSTMSGENHVDECIFDGTDLELKTVLDAQTSPNHTQGVYSCPSCYMVYFMPVSPEKQKEIDERARNGPRAR